MENLLFKILGIKPEILEKLDEEMSARTGKKGVIEKIEKENEKTITFTLNLLNSNHKETVHVRSILRKVILAHEKELITFLEIIEGENEFEKAVKLAKKIVTVKKGFFLKKEYAAEILKKRPPHNLLRYIGENDIGELLKKYDVTEIFSALRFIESDEWMHKTFEEEYSEFKAEDFEERDIEIKVMGPQWKGVAKKFAKKKYHNVSHLKEFGVVFINPIQENIPGKFLRDFALLLHYCHEIEFYSKLFRKYSVNDNFTEKLKMLLRGDVKEVFKVDKGEWLIVQRYLAKENINDPRLFMPRVNPESMHWSRGERDLSLFKTSEAKMNLSLWNNLDWVGGIFSSEGARLPDGQGFVSGGKDREEEVVSFDLEDNAMSLVSFMEGKEEFFNYHQREAMWTKIFSEYVGGEDKMEKILMDNFDKGVVKF